MNRVCVKKVAIILAGGLSSRMGKEKALVKLNNKPLIEHIIEALTPQVDQILINSNSDEVKDYYENHFTVFNDNSQERLGPLQGVMSSFEQLTKRNLAVEKILTVPCDTPFIPVDLFNKLSKHNQDIVIASSAGRDHYSTALWNKRIHHHLADYLNNGGRSIRGLLQQFEVTTVEFDFDNQDPFSNFNSPEDLEAHSSK